MGNIKQRLEKIEKAAYPKETAVVEWTVRCVSAEQEFCGRFNEMKERYHAGEPSPLLTHDEILEKARALMWRYGTEKVYRQAFIAYEKSPEAQKVLTEMKKKYA